MSLSKSLPHGVATSTSDRAIRGPDELIAAVPYLLGFHPAESLVLVGLAGGRLVVTARLDLADVEGSDGAVVTSAVHAAHRGGAREFVLIAYPAGEASGLAALEHAERAIVAVGGRVLDALVVGDDRYRSVFCDEDCCPPQGRATPDAPTPFVMAAVLDGVTVMPDRATRAASLDPVGDPEALRPALLEATHHVSAEDDAGRGARWERAAVRAVFAAARASQAPRWIPPNDGEVVRLAVALGSDRVRDAVWLAIEAGEIDGRSLWHEIAVRCPAPFDASALFLYGWTYWRAGNGMLAGLAASRALQSSPDYAAAQMLDAAVLNGLDPHSVPRIRRPSRRGSGGRRRTGR